MAENQQQTGERGNNKKAGNRKKAAPKRAPKATTTSETTAAQATAKKAAARKKAAPKRPSRKVAPKLQVSPEERYRMIQEAAYFQAEKEDFNCDPWKCWLVAEAEIAARLSGSR